MSFPRRGEIFLVSLDPTVGSEIAKTRPGLIISNDIGNRYSDRVIVAPITSGGTERVYPFEVRLQRDEGGLSETSKAMLDQMRSVDKQRLGRWIGNAPAHVMQAIDQAIRLTLVV